MEKDIYAFWDLMAEEAYLPENEMLKSNTSVNVFIIKFN